jgi:hypothetical protein
MYGEDGKAATDNTNSQLRLRLKGNSSNDAFLCVIQVYLNREIVLMSCITIFPM